MPNKFEVFWGEISPCEHLVQIYDQEDAFMDSLEGFVSGGIRKGDGVVVIALPKHLENLEARLRSASVDLRLARLTDQYIPVNAEAALKKFLVNGWPDENRFTQFVTSLITRAAGNGRRVRAFGEMVAVMWEQGHQGATVRLEHLWHQFCHRETFSLFCAYPKSGFTEEASASIKQICAAHSKVVAADGCGLAE
ncbi:MAG: hypothetical protein JWQ71_3022 [Pedosphaera sp.]|nr:hypothetical protein [Pedosphaera sp.]